MVKKSFKIPALNIQFFLMFALCLLISMAPFLRGLYFEEYFLPFSIGITALFIVFLVEQYKKGESGFFNHPLDWALLVLLLAYVLSLLTSVNIRAALGGVIKYCTYFMTFWMCYRIAQRGTGYSIFSWFIYFGGLIMAVFGLLVYCGAVHYPYIQPGARISGTFEYANTMGIYMAITLLIGWGLVLSNKNKVIKSLLAGANSLIFISMLGSLSRGTWLLFPFAILAFVLLTGDKKSRINALILFIATIIPGFLMGRLFLSNTTIPSAITYAFISFILAAILLIGIDYLDAWLRSFTNTKRNCNIAALGAVVLLSLFLILTFPALKEFFGQGPFSRLTQISLHEENVEIRSGYFQDALKIIKDHPITGVGAGGWEALYHHYSSHLYWSTKTHNFFLQTWVESGTFGFIALITVWFALIHVLWKHWKKPFKEKNKPDELLFWAGVVALFTLAIHSIIDFDMSYPSIAYILFGLIGALQGYSIDSTEMLSSKSQKRRQKHTNKNKHIYNDLTKIVLSGIASCIIFLFALSLWLGSINFHSAQKVTAQNPNRALELLNNAMHYDPLNANYVNQAASFYSSVALSTKDYAAYQNALAYCEKVVNLEPYNIKYLNNVNQIYMNFGLYDKALSLAAKFIEANPWDPASYENMANCYLLHGLSFVNSGDIKTARTNWDQALLVNNRIPQNMDVPAVGLHYTSGQAYLFLGNSEQAEQQFKTMLTLTGWDSKGAINKDREDQVKHFKLQSQAWLLAIAKVSGSPANIQKVLDNVRDADQPEVKAQAEQFKVWLDKISSLDS